MLVLRMLVYVSVRVKWQRRSLARDYSDVKRIAPKQFNYDFQKLDVDENVYLKLGPEALMAEQFSASKLLNSPYYLYGGK